MHNYKNTYFLSAYLWLLLVVDTVMTKSTKFTHVSTSRCVHVCMYTCKHLHFGQGK